MRRVKPQGSGSVAQEIPASFMDRIEQPVEIDRATFRQYLEEAGIAEADIGGDLDGGMPAATRPDGTKAPARYFVIHDTSSPELEGVSSFPDSIDEATWPGNKISPPSWSDTANRVHAIVNRAGASRGFRDFEDPRSSLGIKLEQNNFAPASKNVFIHVENIQPRIKPAGSWAHIAPIRVSPTRS